MKRIQIAPSLLSADFLHLGDAVGEINLSDATMVHLDVMDGAFVPNISFGMGVIKAVAAASTKLVDVHLMIAEPERYINAFVDAGAQTIQVHAEACLHLHRVIEQIRAAGAKAVVAINPATSLSILDYLWGDIFMVNLMGVNPGFGGQSFIAAIENKIRSLRYMADQHQPDLLIQLDGGVSLSNASVLAAAGADVLVAGNAVFKEPNLQVAINNLCLAANHFEG